MDPETNGYGGGSGGGQNTQGGEGCYASSPVATGITGLGHGNRIIVPLAGGSGGASGNPNGLLEMSGYGGGGGGAIAISAPVIKINEITANGFQGGNNNSMLPSANCSGGAGSGGAIIINGRTITELSTVQTHQGGNSGSIISGYTRYSGIITTTTTPTGSRNTIGIANDTTKYIDRLLPHTIVGAATNFMGLQKVYLKSETGV